MAFKGITFDKQLFKSNEFALINKKFFNGVDGRVYGVTITNTTTTIILSPGYFISSGYYTRITSNEIINVINGTWTLIYEIDLSKLNTEDIFNQGTFKLINTALRKDDLFNGTGTIYQLALATVTMVSGTITLFSSVLNDITSDIFSTLATKVDKIMGKGLSTKDYTAEEQTKLAGIATGATKNEIAILEGSYVCTANTQENQNQNYAMQTVFYLPFPAGFTRNNCIVVDFLTKWSATGGYFYGVGEETARSFAMATGAVTRQIQLGHEVEGQSESLRVFVYNFTASAKTIYYKIVLMKIA